MRLTPKKSVKVKKQTPLNHARIVAHVKPVKKVRKFNARSGFYVLRTGIMLSRLIKF